MEVEQLRCFVAAAEALHFAQAAARLEMLPSAFGRNIRLLEESLGCALFARTTRSVALTEDGRALLVEARGLIAQADDLCQRFRERVRQRAEILRLGAIDTASAGLVPLLLADFRRVKPQTEVQLSEDKTIRLLPRLLCGSLDLAVVRPPAQVSRRIAFMPLFDETAVLALPADHPLAGRDRVAMAEIAGEGLIVPNRRSRPHSHDLSVKLTENAGLRPMIAQIAEEKQTIISLVAAGLGIAIVPRWTSRMAVNGVTFVRLREAEEASAGLLPLAAAWLRGTRDPAREAMLHLLRERLSVYAAEA